MKVKNSVVLVTGGASGLGAATVEHFIQNGAKAVICDLNEKAGHELAKKYPSDAIFLKTDVCSEEHVQNAVDAAWDNFQSLDVVINCAGIVIPKKILSKEGEPHSLSEFRKAVEINLIGTFNVDRLAVASMAKRKNTSAGDERGVLIHTASIAAFEGQIGQVSYSASKGGLVSMTLQMARELAPLGIRVLTIAPGIFETPMLAGLPENVRASLGQQVPFPSRLGRPSEYANLAQHLVENSMLNGTVIRLDGAMRMAAR